MNQKRNQRLWSDTLVFDLQDVFKFFDSMAVQILADINQNQDLSCADRSVLAEKLQDYLCGNMTDDICYSRFKDPKFNQLINRIVEYRIAQSNRYKNSWQSQYFGGVQK